MNPVGSADKAPRSRPLGRRLAATHPEAIDDAPFRFFLAGLSAAAALYPGFAAETPPPIVAAPQVLSLEDCMRIAMEKNRSRPASRFAVAMAEAQHRQALAGYWPQVTAKAGYFRLDQSPNFVFPASAMAIPAQTVNVPAGTAIVTIPAEAFAPGFPAAPIQMPVAFPGQRTRLAARNGARGRRNFKAMV